MSNTDPTGEFAWGLAFAGADLAWQLYQNGGNFKCVNWVDVGLSALGGGLFSKAFRKLPGKEWSHWIPDRYIRKFSVSGKTTNKHYRPNVDKYLGGFVKSRFNGNFVSKETHALTDAYRYKFMSRTWKASNPMMNTVSQQVLRTPGWIPGSGLIGGRIYDGVTSDNSNCGCGE